MIKLKHLFIFCFLTFSANAQITANWHATGPIAFPINVSGQINGIGRVCQLKFHPTNPSKVYAASASGGLWVSNNGGLLWKNKGTDFLPATACASVCIDFTNDSILYLGTGDPNYYNTNYGIWKSSDAGATWIPANSGIGNRMAVELLMNPNNHNELIAATDDGIWKTYNGGLNWSLKKSGGAFKDMKFKASTNSDTIFAVTSSQYFRSLNMGETWSLITNGVFVPNGNGEGMRIAVSPANPDIVYIGMVADGGTILKSTDAGASFTTAYHNPGQMLVGYTATTSGQGNYNFGMTADPLNADNVLVVAHCVWRSNDAALTWTKLTDWAIDCHTDMHQIIYSPYNPNNLLNANDGGVFVSHDDGDNWDPFSDGLEATECYHAAQSPMVTNSISIGTQDNGELYYDNQWKTNRGGDWTDRMAYDYLIPNRVYYFSGNRRVVSGSDQPWGNPISGNARAMLFSTLQPNAAFVASSNVYRTLNLNAFTPSWTAILANNSSVKAMAVSPNDANDLYVVTNNLQIKHSVNALATTPTFTTLTAPSSTANTASIAISKLNSNVVYLTCGSNVYRSINQGSTWVAISSGLPPVNIIKIYLDEYSPNEAAYVCSAAGVYYKNDTMSSWINYSQGLPTIADIQDFMLTQDGAGNSILRVAYYGRGVWESGLYQPYLAPVAHFTALDTIICSGDGVQFQNLSSTNTLSYSWTFQGGTPASSNLPNPLVHYSIAGDYSVSLSVSNNLGSDTTVKQLYIHVEGNNPLPLQENFSGVFPPSGWRIIDAFNDGINWQQSFITGGFGTSNECLYFDNYNIDAQGHRDAVRTPTFNLSNSAHAQLSFDVAYAMNTAPFYDTLVVYVSYNCDQNRDIIYLKDASTLQTAPPSPNVTFVPTASQWRNELISLDSYIGESNLALIFENRGYAGQELYIDNVNLVEPLGSTSGIKNNSINVYPNPSESDFTLSFSDFQNQKLRVEVYSSSGVQVLSKFIFISKTTENLPLEMNKFGKGIYFLHIKNESGKTVYQQKLTHL